MTTKPVWQTDYAGYYLGETTANESPLEPGVFLIPAGCAEEAPPRAAGKGKEWRWDGEEWQEVEARKPVVVPSPADKLRQFLQQNPDVQGLIDG